MTFETLQKGFDMKLNIGDVINANEKEFVVVDTHSTDHNTKFRYPVYTFKEKRGDRIVKIDKIIAHEKINNGQISIIEKSDYYPWSVKIGDFVKRFDDVNGNIVNVIEDIFVIEWNDGKTEEMTHVDACRSNDYFHGKWVKTEWGTWKYVG